MLPRLSEKGLRAGWKICQIRAVKVFDLFKLLTVVITACVLACAHSKADVIDPDMPFFGLSMDFRDFGENPIKDNLVPRGIVLPLGDDVYACFDTDLLRIACVWQAEPGEPPIDYQSVATFSYENTKKKADGGQEKVSKPLGKPIMVTGLYPGLFLFGDKDSGKAFDLSEILEDSVDGKFDEVLRKSREDPRPGGMETDEIGKGPHGEFLGILDNGAGRVPSLRYGLGDAILVETLRWEKGMLLRSFEVEEFDDRLHLVLMEPVAKKRGSIDEVGPGLVQWFEDGSVLLIASDPWNPPSQIAGTLTASTRPESFRYTYWQGSKEHINEAEKIAKSAALPIPESLEKRILHWPETYTTAIQPGKGDLPYTVDQIALPDIKRKIRPAGIAFLEPGEAVVVAFDGDLWKVSGLTAESTEATWRRIGAGLHEPMSVEVVDGEIFVFTRAAIQKVVMGEDGEVSEYVTVCDDFTQSADTRDFPLSFAPDGEGGFYFTKGGQQMPYRTPHCGRALHVDEAGNVSVFATGLRNAFLCRNPKTGLITATDQQGHWVPATPVHVLEKGGYYGFNRAAPPGDEPPVYPPLSWIPHIQAQSGTGQVWTAESGFGPLGDSLLMLDFFRPSLLEVDVESGVVLPLRLKISMPLLKAAVNPADGMPYFAGFQIWGTASETLAGISRLRYTGVDMLHPVKIRYGKEGVLVRFNEMPDEKAVVAPGTWDVQCWNYLRSKNYGSGHYKLDGSPGQEYLAVRSAHLSKDGKAVFLDVPGMSVAMQMQVAWKPLSEKLPTITDMACFTPSKLNPLDLKSEGFAAIDFAELEKLAQPLAASDSREISIARGEHVYSLFGCVACHSTDGSTDGKSGPTWKGLYLSEREFLGRRRGTADDVYLRDAILNPAKEIVKGFDPKDVGMPSYAGILPESDVESLLLFIQSLGSHEK